MKPSGNSTYFYYVGGKLVVFKKNGTTYIVQDNLQGDVETITDTSGNIVAQAHFDPWGNRISSSGSLVQPMRYAGYYYDDETGLYYLKSRYYSPVLGRFLTRDDIDNIATSDPQTLNLYSYCLNNPVSMADPEGTNPLAVPIAIEAAEAIGYLVNMTAWLGLESAKEYIQQTAADVWAALESYWTKPVNLPSWKTVDIDMKHIESGHSSGGNRGGPNKDKFPDWMTSTAIAESVRQAYRYGELITRQEERVFMRGPWGNRHIEMWVNTATKQIETAWPK